MPEVPGGPGPSSWSVGTTCMPVTRLPGTRRVPAATRTPACHSAVGAPRIERPACGATLEPDWSGTRAGRGGGRGGVQSHSRQAQGVSENPPEAAVAVAVVRLCNNMEQHGAVRYKGWTVWLRIGRIPPRCSRGSSGGLRGCRTGRLLSGARGTSLGRACLLTV